MKTPIDAPPESSSAACGKPLFARLGRLSRSRTCRRSARPAAARAARPGGRRRSGSRPRCARRGSRRSPGSRTRRRVPPTRRSRRSARGRAASASRNVTRVVSSCSLLPAPASRGRARRRPRACAPTSALEHRLGLAASAGLPNSPPSQHHGRVDAEHRPVAGAVRTDRALPARARHGIDVAGRSLVVVGRDDVERDPQLLEDRAPLRRRRREQSGDAAAATRHRLRARQISSHGQLLRPLGARSGSTSCVRSRSRRVELDELDRSRSRSRAAGGSSRRGRAGTRSSSASVPVDPVQAALRPLQRLASVRRRRSRRARERRVAEEDEPAAGAQQPRRLGDPLVRVAPDRGAVLGERRGRRTRPGRPVSSAFGLDELEARARTRPPCAARSSSCAGVTSTPTTRRARASQATRRSTRCRSRARRRRVRRRRGSTPTSDSGTCHIAPVDLALRPRVVRARVGVLARSPSSTPRG